MYNVIRTDRLTAQTAAALAAACDATVTDQTTMDTYQVIGLFGLGRGSDCGSQQTTGTL